MMQACRFTSDRVLLIVDNWRPSQSGAFFFLRSVQMSEMIVFTCPNTGRDVPVAIVRGDVMLRDIPKKEVQVACMECGKTHTWKIEQGRQALTEELPKPARVA